MEEKQKTQEKVLEIDGILYELHDENNTAKIIGTDRKSFKTDNLTINIVKSGESTYRIIEIGDGAFYFCGSLKTIELGANVETIGVRAFSDCKGLTSVRLGANIKTIRNNAFACCSSLIDIIIPEGKKLIDEADKEWTVYKLLENRDVSPKLKVGIVRDNIKYVLNNENNTAKIIGAERKSFKTDKLTVNTVEAYGTVYPITEIGAGAFYFCGSLKTIELGANVETIGKRAFSDCEGLTSVKLGTNLKTIGKRAFYNCTGLTEVEIPNSVETIEKSAFYDCEGLTSVKLGANLKTIEESAFAYCENLQNIILPAGKKLYAAQTNKIWTVEELLQNRNNSPELKAKP